LNIGATAAQTPLKIIQPILDAASLEDDSDLQDIWANILANATDSRNITPVGPMFASILRSLGAREVGFLDALYTNALDKAEGHPFFNDASRMPYQIAELQETYARLGIVQEGGEQDGDNRFWLMLDIIQSYELLRVVYMSPLQAGQPSSEGIIRKFHLLTLERHSSRHVVFPRRTCEVRSCNLSFRATLQ
jgi:hypothetical protein